jgi:hypothetical protein
MKSQSNLCEHYFRTGDFLQSWTQIYLILSFHARHGDHKKFSFIVFLCFREKIKRKTSNKWTQKHVLNLRRCKLNTRRHHSVYFTFFFDASGSRVSVHRSSSSSNKQMKLALSLLEINFSSLWNFHGISDLFRRTCWCIWRGI